MKHSNRGNRNLLQYFDTLEVLSIQPILIKSLEKLSSSAKSELFHKKEEERQHYILDAVSTHNRRVTLFFSPKLSGFSMSKKRPPVFLQYFNAHSILFQNWHATSKDLRVSQVYIGITTVAFI